MSKANKTLNEAMGLRNSYGSISVGDTVRIIHSGHVGKIEFIGHRGLMIISGVYGAYAPWEVEKVDKKETA
jgi:hypothetical protein